MAKSPPPPLWIRIHITGSKSSKRNNYALSRLKTSSCPSWTVCPGSSDPFYIASLLFKISHYFLEILYFPQVNFFITSTGYLRYKHEYNQLTSCITTSSVTYLWQLFVQGIHLLYCVLYQSHIFNIYNMDKLSFGAKFW